jgi:hypothetical protein
MFADAPMGIIRFYRPIEFRGFGLSSTQNGMLSYEK